MTETGKRHPKRTRKSKKKAQHEEIVSGIIYRGENDQGERPLDTKIVFLGKKNLEKLRGYKAFLDLWPNSQLSLTLTGLSQHSAVALYQSLEEMKDEEIHGE